MDTDTDLDTYIRSEDSIDSDSGESDTESDAELDVELNVESNAGLNVGLDSKAKEILKDIAELEKEGPVKLNHTTYTKKLWKREGEIWKK